MTVTCQLQPHTLVDLALLVAHGGKGRQGKAGQLWVRSGDLLVAHGADYNVVLLARDLVLDEVFLAT